MSTFEKADEKAVELMKEVMTEHHPEFILVGVTVGLLFAYPQKDKNGDPTGVALKHNGFPAAGLVKVNNLRDRVSGLPDATIIVDGDRWVEWSVEQRKALLDHELEHLVIQYDDDGKLKIDDSGRPKLKLREHDWEITGFDCVVRRHKTNAIEYQEFAKVYKNLGQMELFPLE